MNNPDAPIFIVGCDRSGTTLLRLMLTQSPDVHILHETGFLNQLREREADYGDFTASRQRWYFLRDLQSHKATTETISFSAFNLSAIEAETVLEHAAPTDFAGACRALFEASARQEGAVRWGDKTPAYVEHIPYLAEVFPDAIFLHIIRDGRDVVASMLKAGWYSSPRAAARHWRQRVQAGQTGGVSLEPGRYHETRYEVLVRQPEEALRAVCDAMGIPYSPSMIDFHTKSKDNLPDAHEEIYAKTREPVDASRAQAWKEEMHSRYVADIESEAGRLLQALGYELTGEKIPFRIRLLRKSMELGKPLVQNFQ